MLYGNKRSSSCRNAFTLIELLIVVSIMSIVIGVIGACLSGGIRVWDSARVFNDLEADAFIALNILEKDIRNSLSVYAVGFDGKESSVAFPAYIDSEDGRGIGRVNYEFDQVKHALLRVESSWQGRDGRSELLLENVKDLSFTYYQVSTSAWNSVGETVTNFPDKVGVKLLLGRGEREVEIERSVLLPLQGRW